MKLLRIAKAIRQWNKDRRQMEQFFVHTLESAAFAGQYLDLHHF